MFGYLRFILANIVLLSHTGLTPEWGNLGATSVTIFYMLSGFVITNILNNFSKKKERIIDNFYIDRVFRIFPLYIIILILYSIYLLKFDLNFSIISFLQNLILIPCNYIKDPIIPVSWSLALEFQMFIIMPFLHKNRVLFYMLGFISMVIFFMSNLSYLDKYSWGYYKLPGVIFIFLTGSIIAKSKKNIIEICLPISISVISFVGLLLIELGFIERGGFQSEVLLGTSLGVPLIMLLKGSKKLIYNSELGSMSYSIFLIHYLFIFILKGYNLNYFFYNLLIFSLSLFFSIMIYYLIEKKITNWRLNLN